MAGEVATLPFQAHANYGTLSIDFGRVQIKGKERRNFPLRFNSEKML